jgi:hypothetical protein
MKSGTSRALVAPTLGACGTDRPKLPKLAQVRNRAAASGSHRGHGVLGPDRAGRSHGARHRCACPGRRAAIKIANRQNGVRYIPTGAANRSTRRARYPPPRRCSNGFLKSRFKQIFVGSPERFVRLDGLGTSGRFKRMGGLLRAVLTGVAGLLDIVGGHVAGLAQPDIAAKGFGLGFVGHAGEC